MPLQLIIGDIRSELWRFLRRQWGPHIIFFLHEPWIPVIKLKQFCENFPLYPTDITIFSSFVMFLSSIEKWQSLSKYCASDETRQSEVAWQDTFYRKMDKKSKKVMTLIYLFQWPKTQNIYLLLNLITSRINDNFDWLTSTH